MWIIQFYQKLFIVNKLYSLIQWHIISSNIKFHHITLPSIQAQANGFQGPCLGPKESAKNVREFTDDQLAAGQGVIGLQMGTNKLASQKVSLECNSYDIKK